MSNFTFLQSEFRPLADAAQLAEQHIMGDARAACFHARFALEAAVHWLYKHERSLRLPYDQNLGALLHEPSFQKLLPEQVFQKTRVIQKVGNLAVHSQRPIRQYDALQVVKELHHVFYWIAKTYSREGATEKDGVAWKDDRVPLAVPEAPEVPRKELEELEAKLEERNKADLRKQQEVEELDAELKQLRQELAAAKAENEQKVDTHDYSEALTRRYLIDVDLRKAGWPLDQKRDHEYEVTGMPTASGIGYADYVLWGDDGKPLAVVEAKKTTVDPAVGRQQAKLYADCLERMHGQRPVIFFTNGYANWIWDDTFYPPREVAGFYKKDELTRLILRRTTRKPLDAAELNLEIVERYYQKRVIASLCNSFAQHQRKGLLVMATGTGKTRTSIALVDILQRANWAKRVLFLADRVSLVKQACNAFKAHLPESSPVNLVTEKEGQGRVYVCTYPTMMGLIDQTDGGESRYGVGHFDLIIIDEAHRSVYQKYGEIFRYFDSLLIGLTATPREQVDRNTYELFDLEPGVPTDAYELEKAVSDGFLVPPMVEQVDLKFPREGIDYDSLSDEEKAEWESLDWGDDEPEGALPDRVNAAAINSWLFNKDTVDKVLKHVMKNGYKVEGGDRLGKTIIFARNHEHAKFISERFDIHYPQYAGQFARIVDNYEKYAQSLIDDFSQKDKAPHMAISVDMLDTGIDVPEVLNLVFFKPVYSKIKFWQMIGRGTRLCPDLFGPEEDKENFRIFDFCFNFDFFNENPDGIEPTGGMPLGARLFRSRVQLLSRLQHNTEDGELYEALKEHLHGEVSSMNRENFIVRGHLEAVERFQKREAWENLSEEDQAILEQEVAHLPSETKNDPIESRLFDLTILRMQLAKIEGDTNAFEKDRKRVVDMAMLFEEKSAIPAVHEQLGYLEALQETSFWEGIGLGLLEEMRLRLRELMPLLDKKKRKIVYTNFEDEIQGVREDAPMVIPKMTGAQYEKKVKEYLKTHQDSIAIQRLRHNEPLTPKDLESLQEVLVQIGEDEGEQLLSGLLERSEAPSLAYFVRKLVGMDRQAALKAFSEYLNDTTLTPQQIRFIELLVDQLTAQGVVEPSALYEPPFSDMHGGGPEAVFEGKDDVIEGLFGVLSETRKPLEKVN